MKLRSIALAGLLGAGLMMSTGCTEEDVLDELGDLLKENVVYTVNGTGADVTFSVGTDTQLVTDKQHDVAILAGADSYAASYTPNNGITPVSFNDGSVYIYAATTCTSAGHLEHEVNVNKINIINLSATDITPGADTSIVVTQADGTTKHTITETVGNCSVVGAPSLNNVVLENNMNISVVVGGVQTTNYTVTGIDPDLIALGNSLKVDVVIFSDDTLAVVPMAGYSDLIAIGSN